MLNKNLPQQEEKTFEDNMIRLKDGEEFTGIILNGEEVTTSFGPAVKFTFDINGKEMVFFTTNTFVIGKFNNTTKGDTLRVQRNGMGRATRWDIQVIDRVAGK